jgi:hypothetical protein
MAIAKPNQAEFSLDFPFFPPFAARILSHTTNPDGPNGDLKKISFATKNNVLREQRLVQLQNLIRRSNSTPFQDRNQQYSWPILTITISN